MLTHVELPYEAGDIVVFEVLGEQLLGKPLLIQNAEILAILGNKQKYELVNKHSFSNVLLSNEDHKSAETVLTAEKGKRLHQVNCLWEHL